MSDKLDGIIDSIAELSVLELSELVSALEEKFGVEGELFKKRQELIKPLQDRIYDAIKELAEDRSYSAIFDKANNTNILYSDPKYDKSETVLKNLGISGKDKEDK